MTTIAFDGKYLVADMQMSFEDERRRARKLFVTPKGIAAIYGDGYNSMTLVDWLMSPGKDYPVTGSEEGVAVLITPDKRIFMYSSARSEVPIEIEDTLYSVGSGGSAAMGAMLAGADAIRAVQIACMIDNYSGLGLTIANVETQEIFCEPLQSDHNKT